MSIKVHRDWRLWVCMCCHIIYDESKKNVLSFHFSWNEIKSDKCMHDDEYDNVTMNITVEVLIRMNNNEHIIYIPADDGMNAHCMWKISLLWDFSTKNCWLSYSFMNLMGILLLSTKKYLFACIFRIISFMFCYIFM